MAKDAKTNFLLLFRPNEEVIPIIDEDGKERKVKVITSKPVNVIRTLGQIKGNQWLFFWCASFAIFADYVDFYLLAIQGKKLAAYFGTTKAAISSSITYTLLLRPVGAIFFGTMGDYMGRKWPMVLDCILMGTIQIASIYCTTLKTFLAARAMFGIAMGGIWGCAAAMAMERTPPEARGILSGILQGFAPFGYAIAGCINLGVGGGLPTWKTTFWISAGISFAAAIFRAVLPESPQFVKKVASDASERDLPLRGMAKLRAFWRDFCIMMKHDWQRFIYMILFVTSIVFLSHAAVDSYVTYLLVVKGLSNRAASEIAIIARTGGFVGSVIYGWLSQFLGRRRIVVFNGICILALIPAYLLPSGFGALTAGGFFMNFCMDGLAGLLPIHLNELAPPSFRAVMPGTAFQLGAMISAPSAQIVNTIAEGKHIMWQGKRAEAYGPAVIVFTAVCAFIVIILAAIGPERRGSHFETANAAGTQRTPVASNRSSSQLEREEVNALNEKPRGANVSSSEEDAKEESGDTSGATLEMKA